MRRSRLRVDWIPAKSYQNVPFVGRSVLACLLDIATGMVRMIN